MENILYEYREKWEGEKPPGRYIICGEKAFIAKYIKKQEFAELFGSYVIWKVKNKNWFFSDYLSIGVYGKRNASRLKRILRERGAEFRIVEGLEPKSRLSSITKDYRPKLRKKGLIK
jgi:hypothetical protein